MNKGVIIKICQVIDIYDDTDGERIKVKLSPEDDRKSINEIPYAFPLLPKLLHIKPKMGEFVLIILTKVSDGHSIRYYIGPIISQPQYMEREDNLISATSLYPGALKEPDVALSTNPDSQGALVKDNDIALYGRKKNDVILTEDDVRIRCGCRVKDENGDIVFNRADPSYILLRHSDTKTGDKDEQYRSSATIVADKINFISHQSNTPFKTNNKNDLITNEELQNIIDKAHELPYGDILVDFLKMFINIFLNHFHAYPGETPRCKFDIKNLSEYNFDKMLSDSIRIN